MATTIGLAVCISGFASSARAQTTITACVNTKTGAVAFISKGACKRGTQPIVLNPPPSTIITVQKVNVVDAANKTVATLGKDSNGNLLTFFDSSGNRTVTVGNNPGETFAGAAAWDNNKVVPGNGAPRVIWGESNPNIGPVSGFGVSVYDGDGNERTALGTSFDLSNNSIVALNPDGSSTGIGNFPSGFSGYYAGDSNGISRQFGGLVSASSSNIWGETDENDVLRVSASQNPATFINQAGRRGNGFTIWDSNGLQEAAMAAFVDGSLAGFNVVDPNNVDRMSAYLTTANGMNLQIRDQDGNLTNHLP